MDKKTLLSLYLENAREIERLEKELEKWEARAKIANTAELQAVLAARLKASAEQRREAERCVEAVEDKKLKAILTYRYIYGLKWEKISEVMHLEYRWLLRLHKRALLQIEAM